MLSNKISYNQEKKKKKKLKRPLIEQYSYSLMVLRQTQDYLYLSISPHLCSMTLKTYLPAFCCVFWCSFHVHIIGTEGSSSVLSFGFPLSSCGKVVMLCFSPFQTLFLKLGNFKAMAV